MSTESLSPIYMLQIKKKKKQEKQFSNFPFADSDLKRSLFQDTTRDFQQNQRRINRQHVYKILMLPSFQRLYQILKVSN